MTDKPEPLTKEKIREAFEKWYFSKPLVPHGLMWTEHSYEGFKAGVEFMKQRVEWLLKEIEKEIEKNKHNQLFHKSKNKRFWLMGYLGGLEITKNLIKKAFEKVLESTTTR